MLKAFKYRIYPTKEQQVLLAKTFGCCRYVYNCYLGKKINIYEEERKTLTYVECANNLKELKTQLVWLKEVDSIALQQSLKDLDKAYGNFFKGSGFPKFKSKHDHSYSYRTQMVNSNIQLNGSKIKLPKLGWVDFIKSRKVEGSIQNVTVSRTNTGKYFISICCETEIQKLPTTSGKIGVDVGIKTFCKISNGEEIENPRPLKKLEQQMKSAQRQLSAKKKGSNNYKKAKLRLAKIHERIANQRYDFLHRLSTRLIRENQTIYLEDLKIKNMVRNQHLSKSIHDCSWSEFFRMLQYKAEWYGRSVYRIDTFFPSSQLCSNCGYRNPDVKNLSVREWICPVCESLHQRDDNASINILKEGERLHPVT